MDVNVAIALVTVPDTVPPNMVITDMLRKDLVIVVVKETKLAVVVDVKEVEVDEVAVVVEVVDVCVVIENGELVVVIVAVVVVKPGVVYARIPMLPLTSGLTATKAPPATSKIAKSMLTLRIEFRL